MSDIIRKSRVGFVIIKLSVRGIPHFIMRVNPKWKDVNFIGGHEKDRDGGDLKKTARRELWEEVPSVRDYKTFALEPLTEIVHYGPIESRSKGGNVEYELQFFLLRIDRSPEFVVKMLGSRTKNILLPQEELVHQRRYRISGLAQLLATIYPGGLEGIPYSSVTDLFALRDQLGNSSSKQLELALK